MSIIAGGTSSVIVNGKNASRISFSANGRYRVVWSLGDYTHTETVTGRSADYIIPVSWLNAIPVDSKSAVGNIEVLDYGTNTKETTAFAAVMASAQGAPTLASGLATMTVSNASPAAVISAYIQGFARVRVTADDSKITTKYGATVANISMSVGGNEYAVPSTSDVLKESGSYSVRVVVTDSRGFSNSQLVGHFTVQPYSAPTLSNVVLLRSLNNGAPADSVNGDISGSYLYAKATATAASAVGLRNLTLMYRRRGVGTYTSESLSSGVGKAVSISTLHAYDAVITATDKIGNTASISVIIPRETNSFRLKPGGKAAGIGAAPGADDTLTLGWKLILANGLDSYVPLTPVGGCVMLDSGMAPETAFGGTWEQVTWSGAPSGVKLWKRTA